MDDHLLRSASVAIHGHNGWQPGQGVTLRRGPLAGMKGRLSERRGLTRWLVNLHGVPRGLLVALEAADIRLQSAPAGDSLPTDPTSGA